MSEALGYTPPNSADLADVALSGAYADLSGLPAIPAAPGDIGAATAAQGAKADTAVQPGELASVAASGSYADLSAKPFIPALPGDIGAATAAQGAKADTAVQPAALTSGLGGKVDKDGTKVLSDQNYTAAEKAKLAGIEGPQFKGLHISLAALQAAHPTAAAGNYADVDSGTGADVARYIWDVSDSKWVVQSGASGSMTAAQIKTAYESNPDTNAYSDAEQAKLAAIAPNATANATDAALRDRSTHTGTQLAATISDFAATVLGTVLTGLSLANAAAGTATDTVLVFLGKLQGQITALATTVGGKQDALVSGTTLKTVNGTSLLGAGDIALEKYRGLYVSLAALNAAVPTASAGDYADVDSGSGSNVKRYIWDTSDAAWVEQAGSGAGMSNPMTTAGDMIVGGAAGVPTRLPAGSNTQVMTIVGGVPAWSTPSAGGGSLVNFAENLSTSSPNTVTYAARLLPVSAGATDIDFVVEPKGVGALLRKVPDGTAAGGAKRGSRATDLQASRSAASQVASGADSFAAGADNTASGAWSCAVGYSNTASGSYSVVFGYGNLAQQSACVALGQSNSATGSQSVAIGNNNTSSGGIAFALGNGCEASGTSAFAMGATCTASGPYSQATGRQATSRGVIGAKAHSSGQQSTLGDAQTLQLVSRAATTDATSTRLTADNTAASAINQVLIPTNSAVKFRGDVVARNMANGECATWSVSGLIKNVAGTVTLVGTPTATMDLNDTGAAGWTLTITADNTNKSLAITVVGAAATSIRWVSSINTTEVTA